MKKKGKAAEGTYLQECRYAAWFVRKYLPNCRNNMRSAVVTFCINGVMVNSRDFLFLEKNWGNK